MFKSKGSVFMSQEKLIEGFNPKGKVFKFNFTEDTCEKCKTGICVLDSRADELQQDDYDFGRDKNRYPKCINIFYGITSDAINERNSLPLIHEFSCGHFECSEGQHRICVAQRKNLQLDVVRSDLSEPCSECVEIKKDCPGINIDTKNYLQRICSFEKNSINDAIMQVKEHYKHLDLGRKLWGLFGRDRKDDEWVCLEVGSSNDIKSEIVANLRLMLNTREQVWKCSEFHRDRQLFEFWTYSDRQSYKYRKISQICKEFRWCEIDIDKYLKDDKEYPNNIINYAEVKYALETKALFWNPAPATNGNKEKEILNHLRNNPNT